MGERGQDEGKENTKDCGYQRQQGVRTCCYRKWLGYILDNVKKENIIQKSCAPVVVWAIATRD